MRAVLLAFLLCGCAVTAPDAKGTSGSVLVIGIASGCGEIGFGFTVIKCTEIKAGTDCNLAIITPDMQTLCEGKEP